MTKTPGHAVAHPKSEFAILNKKVNPIYVTHKSGQRRELRGPSRSDW